MLHLLSSKVTATLKNKHVYHAGPHVDEGDPTFKSDIEKANFLSQIHFAYEGRTVSESLRAQKEGKDS